MRAPVLPNAPSAAPALRVLLALPGLHRVVRGAEVAFEEVARALARLDGFDVTVIGSGLPRDNEPYRFRRARCIRREFFEKWPSIPYLRGHYAYEEFTFAPGLLTAYSPADFDVTLTCGYPYSNWVLRGRRQHLFGRRPKHVFVTQNGDWMVHANNWEFKHFGCDGLICINPEYYQRGRERYQSALIPNGVDPSVFRPPAGACIRNSVTLDKPGAMCHACVGMSGLKTADGNQYPDAPPAGWAPADGLTGAGSTAVAHSAPPGSAASESSAEARAALGLPAGVPLVLMVSALIPSKRVIEGIRAVAQDKEFHLVVAGDGELRQTVDALAAELLPGRFHRLTLPRDRMPQLYRAADVCLHMSVDEPFGNVYVEAMATGLPIVGHDWAVTRWIVEDCGTLVDTNDAAAVAAALRESMNKRSANDVATRRRRAVEQFSWSAVACQYGDFLRQICGTT